MQADSDHVAGEQTYAVRPPLGPIPRPLQIANNIDIYNDDSTDASSEGWGVIDPTSQAIVKNTFINVVNISDPQESVLKRSASEGDISKSSEPSLSLWSSSNSSDQRRKVEGSMETTPWFYQARLGNAHALDAQKQSRGLIGQISPPSLPTTSSFASTAASQASVFQPPPGIFQGGPPAPPRLEEPSAPDYEPSSAFPTRPSGHFQQANCANTQGLNPTITGSHSSVGTDNANAEGYAHRFAARSSFPRLDDHSSDSDNTSLATEIYLEMKGRVPLEKLQELAQSGILAAIPRNLDNDVSSVGSIPHFSQNCTPCAYWFKRICKYSITCNYCHFVHDGQKTKRMRPSKQTRMRIRRWEAQVAGGLESTPSVSDDLTQRSDSEQDYVNHAILRRLEHL